VIEADIQRTLDSILRREGGHSNNPNDAGGDTYFGITLPFAMQWHIPWPPTEDEARAGYKTMLITTRVTQIPDYATFDLVADCAVNDGSKGIKWLQAAVGTVPDGVIGPKTLAAMQPAIGVNGPDPVIPWRRIYTSVLRARFKFYASIVQNNSSQVEFLGGWINRACEFLT
jgi:lysozyme family protein